jgi:hypothetical protein
MLAQHVPSFGTLSQLISLSCGPLWPRSISINASIARSQMPLRRRVLVPGGTTADTAAGDPACDGASRYASNRQVYRRRDRKNGRDLFVAASTDRQVSVLTAGVRLCENRQVAETTSCRWASAFNPRLLRICDGSLASARERVSHSVLRIVAGVGGGPAAMEVAARALFALIGVALLTQVADGTEMASGATYEWEPLEEVIVGRPDGAVVPPNHVSVIYNKPHSTCWLHRLAV